MSTFTAMYLGAAAVSWLPFALTVGGSRLGERLAAGALLALGWPLAAPLMVVALGVRRRSSRAALRVIRQATRIPHPAAAGDPVAAEL
jgi:hypothetical protein